MNNVRTMWVFSGEEARFPGALFTDVGTAETWISRHGLTGVLTEYPINVGVYDWAIERGWFKPNTAEQETPKFIGKFTTASQEHIHYERGNRVT